MKLRDKTTTEVDKKPTRTLRVRIPKDARESLLEQLDFVGINRATLFLDARIGCEVV